MTQDGTDTDTGQNTSQNTDSGPSSLKTGLKLRAETAEDLVIFSTVLQDAVTIAADMTFLPAEHRFAIMLNRYVWESDPDVAPPDVAPPDVTPKANADTTTARRRIRCGLHFDGVLGVRAREISQKNKSLPLELLAIHAETENDGSGAVYLLFAGGGAVKLEVECIDGYLADIGSAWICKHRPQHQS